MYTTETMNYNEKNEFAKKSNIVTLQNTLIPRFKLLL